MGLKRTYRCYSVERNWMIGWLITNVKLPLNQLRDTITVVVIMRSGWVYLVALHVPSKNAIFPYLEIDVAATHLTGWVTGILHQETYKWLRLPVAQDQ